MTPPQPKEGAPDFLTPEKVAELRALLEAATPGPYWASLHRTYEAQGKNVIVLPEESTVVEAWVLEAPGDKAAAFWCVEGKKDMDFIVAACNALPSLLAEREGLLAKVGGLEEAGHFLLDWFVEKRHGRWRYRGSYTPLDEKQALIVEALAAALKEDTDD